ncbi:hypothetical protein EVAR_31094_1 [Eumeta japonica]|uniref:Uncharacterized protein n=1 Tax=Eumeta variegata TaxID=151549 RepID=A0A4C2ACG3_EUMVA|nr:hypothetical protein EVAR_31094_1 [Eumeta japonica]
MTQLLHPGLHCCSVSDWSYSRDGVRQPDPSRTPVYAGPYHTYLQAHNLHWVRIPHNPVSSSRGRVSFVREDFHFLLIKPKKDLICQFECSGRRKNPEEEGEAGACE